MAYLQKADFTQKVVVSSRGLQPGGTVGPISYTRTRRNMISSPGLLRRMSEAGSAMKMNCSLADHCTTDPKLIGKYAPDGKPYKMCKPEEAAARLKAARECAIKTLSK